MIQYPPGHQAAAKLVHRYLPGATMQQVTGLAKIRILLGTSGYTVTSGSRLVRQQLVRRQRVGVRRPSRPGPPPRTPATRRRPPSRPLGACR